MYGLSESLWVNKEIFSDWFTFHFVRFHFAPPARPLLMLMDGHPPHIMHDFIHKGSK